MFGKSSVLNRIVWIGNRTQIAWYFQVRSGILICCDNVKMAVSDCERPGNDVCVLHHKLFQLRTFDFFGIADGLLVMGQHGRDLKRDVFAQKPVKQIEKRLVKISKVNL